MARDAYARRVVTDAVAARLFASLVADRLAVLGDRSDLEVVSLAVNGERVDVVARSGGDEWRVVFGATETGTVEWVDVIARPPELVPVSGGRAVIVNGPSSSGKSTVLRALKAEAAETWVVFDEPMFGDVEIGHLVWRDGAPSLHRGFLDGIAALARAGNRVALAAGGHPFTWFERAFAGIPTVRVGLDCPADELRRREGDRTDVPGGWAEASLAIHEGWQYDLRFDSSTTSAEVIADEVLRAVDGLSSEPDHSTSA